MDRTHEANYLGEANVGETVVLNGWVDKRRDHGGLIFIDLRDRSGIIQTVFSPEVSRDAFTQAERVRGEYVIALRGVVQRRPENTENPNIQTGMIEVYASEMMIINPAKTPPFYIEDDIGVDEMLRMRYRYLDLRRPQMRQKLIFRHRVIKKMRDILDEKGFIEVETPVLTRSTPEGARDYLVPSRVHPGDFYALPQSPQLFKQMLMVAGMEKYFQFARCFRDEDLRADRQPEFTQLDMEMSFVQEEDIYRLMETMLYEVYRDLLQQEIQLPFPRLTYDEAMLKYGSDKPDTRFGLEIVDLNPHLQGVDFKVFASAIQQGGAVRAINARQCAYFSRKEIDDLGLMAVEQGARGMAWLVVGEQGVKSPIAKFIDEKTMQDLLSAMQAQSGDLILFCADQVPVVTRVLGYLRTELARRLELADPEMVSFCWIIDFPLLEYDQDEKRYVAMHHPFTSPKTSDIASLQEDPGRARARSYDLVLNGTEIGGGSIRIHNRELQETMLQLLSVGREEAIEKFGFMLEAFEYGTPNHGGIALGIDRLLMLMTGSESIRDVIAFPKTQSAACPMTQAPSGVSTRQLEELSLQLKLPPDRE